MIFANGARHAFKTSIFIALLFLNPGSLFSQTSGELDNSFGTNGFVITDVGGIYDKAFSIAIQSDGKIVLGGTEGAWPATNFSLVRYDSFGTIDTAFGDSGIANTDLGNTESLVAIALQADQKIVGVGSQFGGSTETNTAIARFNTDGSLDNNFGVNGAVIIVLSSLDDWAADVAVRPDGKIVVGATEFNFDILQYDSTGTLDPAFGIGGIISTDINSQVNRLTSMALQPDGKIVAGGISYDPTYKHFTLVRYLSNGFLDNSFSTDGKLIAIYDSVGQETLSDVAVQSDGKPIAVGTYYNSSLSQEYILMMRFTVDGIPDSTFNGTGVEKVSIYNNDCFARSVAIQPDGKIVVAGYSYIAPDIDTVGFLLLRFNPDGIPDSTFGNFGIVNTLISAHDEANSCVLQDDGKIVVAGFSITSNSFDFSVARYIATGATGITVPLVSENSIRIFPNPANDLVTISYDIAENSSVQIRVVDLSGRVLQTLTNEKIKKGMQSDQLDISELPAGIYLLQLKTEGGMTSTKIVKQ